MTEAEILDLRRGAEAPVAAGMADIGAVAQDFSAAFSTDPVFNWFLRADARHDAARLKLFQALIAMGLADGEVFRPAGGGAASIWLPSESLGPTPFLQELRALPRIIGATGFSRLSRISAMRRMMDAHHPKAPPHAYLWFLGGRTPRAWGSARGCWPQAWPASTRRACPPIWKAPAPPTCRSTAATASRWSRC